MVAYLPLRVAIVRPADSGATDRPPALISGASRSWLRMRRSEPFAACVSIQGAPGYAHELLGELQAEFREAPRLSITTALTRAVRSSHSNLVEENRLSLPDQRRSASAALAAARGDGIYIARAGSAIVGAVRNRGTWARSGDPSVLGAARETPGIGRPVPPHVTSEFCPLEPGDVALLLPGVSVTDVSDQLLSAALHNPLDLDLVAQILEGTPPETCGMVIWSPGDDAEIEHPERWLDWTSAVAHPEQRPARTPRPPIDRPAAAARAPITMHRTGTALPPPSVRRPPTTQGAPVTQRLPTSVTLPPEVQEALRMWATPPRIAMGVLALLLLILLVRGGIPLPGIGGDHAVEDARRIMQEARANSDPEIASDLYSGAIRILEPRASRDENARLLLQDARESRDRVRNVVHVGRVRTFSFDAGPSFRPAGIWTTENGTFILDLGGQLLYRFDPDEARLAVALRPEDVLDNQPIGRLVTAAWSPARGVDTQGQLLVMDTYRTIISLNAAGSSARRWSPPDNSLWGRLGAAASTFEDVFFVDTDRAEIWRYPARLPGAAGTVVATTNDEPQLGSVLDIATDGNLYVLLSDGGITKLSPGAGPLPFDGLVPDQALAAPSAIYAHEDLDRVWVLEPGAARVVEFTTDGKYVRQYVFPPELLRNAIGLNVDVASQELRILTPQQMVLVQLS